MSAVTARRTVSAKHGFTTKDTKSTKKKQERGVMTWICTGEGTKRARGCIFRRGAHEEMDLRHGAGGVLSVDVRRGRQNRSPAGAKRTGQPPAARQVRR